MFLKQESQIIKKKTDTFNYVNSYVFYLKI